MQALPIPTELPSQGSAIHGFGCRPCAWFWKASGCQNGKECMHCHLCPEGEIKARKKSKNSMMRLGIVTPKSGLEDHVPSFGFPALVTPSIADGVVEGGPASEQEESTNCSFSDQEMSSTQQSEDGWMPAPNCNLEAQGCNNVNKTAPASILRCKRRAGDADRSGPVKLEWSAEEGIMEIDPLPDDQGTVVPEDLAPRYLPLSLPSVALRLPAAPGWDADEKGDTSIALPPGLQPPLGTPSHGSVMHFTGNCRPCVWFWKKNGCRNGDECLHCHLCPEDAGKTRRRAKVAIMRLGLATPKMTHTDTPSGGTIGTRSFQLGRAGK